MSGQAWHLAVLGQPIAHSKSPLLHGAAYTVLGLPWSYEAIEVGSDDLAGFIRSRDDTWRGLSLTMPLKREILPLLDSADHLVELVASANTVLFDNTVLFGCGRVRGFNTDVYGITAALRAAGVKTFGLVQILGAGATAAAAIAAAAELGADTVAVATRSPQKAGPLITLAERFELDVAVGGFDLRSRNRTPDVVVSTLPGGTALDVEFPVALRESVPLLDVAYDPSPTPLAESWFQAGGQVISGLEMLVHQALMQVRVFVNRDPEVALPQEGTVLQAMRASIGLDASPASA